MEEFLAELGIHELAHLFKLSKGRMNPDRRAGIYERLAQLGYRWCAHCEKATTMGTCECGREE
jgi:hypothetical protein